MPPVPRALRLVLVFDEDSWRESVLNTLQDGLESEEVRLVDDFKCYLLTRGSLRNVITDAYVEAHRIITDS